VLVGVMVGLFAAEVVNAMQRVSRTTTAASTTVTNVTVSSTTFPDIPVLSTFAVESSCHIMCGNLALPWCRL